MDMKGSMMKATLLFLTATLFACGGEKPGKEAVRDSLALAYTLLSTLPHNAEAYTQGLVVYNHKILESTGQNGSSWLAEVNPGSGEHDKKVTLDERYFGEGITVLNNKIYHLTWKTKIGFIYDAHTYKQIGDFTYNTQGWGITHDNKNLIMSDGTEKIHFLDTVTLKPVRSITVTDGNNKVKELNELEYVHGYIFANVYQTSMIVKIDPATGKVVGRLDLSALSSEVRVMYPEADVLNGIAYDENSKAFLVTGKLWPKSYLIRVK
jgi:glutaminyl-peptide cyclotransferase